MGPQGKLIWRAAPAGYKWDRIRKKLKKFAKKAKVYKNSADNVCRELEKACECEGGTYAYRSLYTGSATL